MARDLSGWDQLADTGDTMLFVKPDPDGSGRVLLFVVKGATIEPDDDGHRGAWGTFESFTIDGREPTDEEEDTYSDDLRTLVHEILSQT